MFWGVAELLGGFYECVRNDSRRKGSYMNGWTTGQDLVIIQNRDFQTSTSFFNGMLCEPQYVKHTQKNEADLVEARAEVCSEWVQHLAFLVRSVTALMNIVRNH